MLSDLRLPPFILHHNGRAFLRQTFRDEAGTAIEVDTSLDSRRLIRLAVQAAAAAEALAYHAERRSRGPSEADMERPISQTPTSATA